jgi:hypothetical protein
LFDDGKIREQYGGTLREALEQPLPCENMAEPETTPVSPATQPETPQTNEPTLPGIPADVTRQAEPNENPTPSGTDKTALGSKLRRLGAGVVAKFKFRKGRGRPKKCRQCDGNGCAGCDFTGYEPGKADATPDDVARVDALQPAPGLPPDSPMSALAVAPLGDSVRAAAFRRTVGAAVRGIFKIIRGLIFIKAKAAGIDNSFTERAVAEAFPKKEEIDAFTESLDAVLKKHGVEPKNCEEINLAIDGLNLCSGIPLLFATFNAEIERKKLEEKKS